MKAVSLCSKINHHLLLLPKMVSPRGDSVGDLLRNRGVTGLPGSLLVSTAETYDFTCGLFSQDRWDQTIMPPHQHLQKCQLSLPWSHEAFASQMWTPSGLWLCIVSLPLTMVVLDTRELLKLSPPRTKHGEPAGWGGGDCHATSSPCHFCPSAAAAYWPKWQIEHKLYCPEFSHT